MSICDEFGEKPSRNGSLDRVAYPSAAIAYGLELVNMPPGQHTTDRRAQSLRDRLVDESSAGQEGCLVMPGNPAKASRQFEYCGAVRQRMRFGM
ncbi:Uncharacterised protein [Mycobacteroides abscessus subsp. abscessus]|nr:Uncharacterised protein [Mycobacteroides abscessus subsp. abscessus]SHW21219.1 Uncharacterised protein [Mycobacteroides abscessus subsp. abscessus]